MRIYHSASFTTGSSEHQKIFRIRITLRAIFFLTKELSVFKKVQLYRILLIASKFSVVSGTQYNFQRLLVPHPYYHTYIRFLLKSKNMQKRLRFKWVLIVTFYHCCQNAKKSTRPTKLWNWLTKCPFKTTKAQSAGENRCQRCCI